MADGNKKAPDWFDPLGLRGSKLDPFALMGEAARLMGPPSQSFAWMVTTVAKRLEGRRFEIRRDPVIAGRVAMIHEVVPATSIPLPGLSSSIALWDRARLTVDDLTIGAGRVDKIEVSAEDVRVTDATAQRVSVRTVGLVVTLTSGQVAQWLGEMDVDAEFDFETETFAVRPAILGRWLSVVVEPTLVGRRAVMRPTGVKLARWLVPVPSLLARSRSHELDQLPPGVELVGMSTIDADRVEVRMTARDLDLAVDLPRLITDVGVEGTRSVVRVLGSPGRTARR